MPDVNDSRYSVWPNSPENTCCGVIVDRMAVELGWRSGEMDADSCQIDACGLSIPEWFCGDYFWMGFDDDDDYFNTTASWLIVCRDDLTLRTLLWMRPTSCCNWAHIAALFGCGSLQMPGIGVIIFGRICNRLLLLISQWLVGGCDRQPIAGRLFMTNDSSPSRRDCFVTNHQCIWTCHSVSHRIIRDIIVEGWVAECVLVVAVSMIAVVVELHRRWCLDFRLLRMLLGGLKIDHGCSEFQMGQQRRNISYCCKLEVETYCHSDVESDNSAVISNHQSADQISKDDRAEDCGQSSDFEKHLALTFAGFDFDLENVSDDCFESTHNNSLPPGLVLDFYTVCGSIQQTRPPCATKWDRKNYINIDSYLLLIERVFAFLGLFLTFFSKNWTLHRKLVVISLILACYFTEPVHSTVHSRDRRSSESGSNGNFSNPLLRNYQSRISQSVGRYSGGGISRRLMGDGGGASRDTIAHGVNYVPLDDSFDDFPSESTNGLRKYYTNTWAVRVDGGGREADRVAASHGFSNLGEIMEDSNLFLFLSPRDSKKATRRSRRASMALRSDPNIKWVEQQVAKKRVKRGFRAYRSVPNDPQWTDMWYLNRQKLDMNVQKAWEMGYTGRDIVVTILDDGLEFQHPDIQENYDPLASHDINDNDKDPTPRYDLSNQNRHGTRCAGEVAAVFNNNVCVVGIAHRAKIGGIRMLDGDVTDAVEARSLAHNKDHIDIYSASWGPDDDGRTVDGPGRMASKAFKDGIVKGRKGKGSIFVWASGNGGRDADSCNCDGYTNSIYTLSISSATEHGNIPWYSEACSSTLATTFSSGSHGERMIVTTDLHSGCTTAHTGTSASAPLAAAMVALALEANPNLTWRDMQHIVVRSARPQGLSANDWIVNGINRNVSHSFGFGLMDAGEMVKLAKNWTTVPDQRRCDVQYREYSNSNNYAQPLKIPERTKLQVVLKTDGCAGDSRNRVRYLEHVQAVVTLAAPKRGDIQIFLISPAGTRSTLLAKRSRDTNRGGFRDWAFMTTHNWGERAEGTWILEIQNDGYKSETTYASLRSWKLVLYGTDSSVGPHGAASSPLHLFTSTFLPPLLEPSLGGGAGTTSVIRRSAIFWLMSLIWYALFSLLA